MSGRGALFGARLASVLRAGEGARAGPIGRRPSGALELYEFEACPFCRRVREALTRLDLAVLVRPCPKGGRRNRERLLALGGLEQFPFLVDLDAGRQMYESSDIVAHLEREYGAEEGGAGAGGGWRRSTAALVASGLGRGAAGSRARPSRGAREPLVLYGFEAQPESRLVRESLCELELDYWNRPIAPGGAQGLGGPSAPTLVDPNTGTSQTGWRAIVDHLEATYALA